MNRPPLITRLAGIMLVMSIACAASGVLLDYRVIGLLQQARDGNLLQDQLEQADQVATLLLLLTLIVNLGALALFWMWLVRSGRRIHTLVLVALVLVLNPVSPLFARGLDSGLVIALSAKALAGLCAVFAFEHLRRAPRRVIVPAA